MIGMGRRVYSECDGERFAVLLTAAVHRIKWLEGKPVAVIHDELGYALGKQGGAMIEHWRKGHLPARRGDVERLAGLLMQRGRLDRAWGCELLAAAGIGHVEAGVEGDSEGRLAVLEARVAVLEEMRASGVEAQACGAAGRWCERGC